jgi:hypothetical protein
LRKIQKIPPKVAQQNESWYVYPQGVYYLCGVFFLAFDIAFR